MGELEVYVTLECTVRLYLRASQRPVEHRCRLTLGSSRPQKPGQSSCVLSVEGKACQRRAFRVTKENVTKVVARLGEGSMTVVFKEGCCDSIVIKEVVDRGALTLCHKIISEIWMGVGEAAGGGTQWLGSSPTGRSGDSGGQSLSASGKRKMELTLKKRYGDTRGSRMLEAAAHNKSATTSSFYKTESPAVESFLPQTPPSSSPYFQRPARRNLNLELSTDRPQGVRGGPQPSTTPQDRDSGGRGLLGPRRAAVIARKRLPLGDIREQTTAVGVATGSSELKDFLTIDEPPSTEGFANLGNTCYMNAVLQVLLGMEPFAEDLLNQKLIKQVDSQSLCRMMYLLLKSKRAQDSYESQRILLKKIKSVIEANRPKFSGYRQQDAHELLTQCLDQLKDDSKGVRVPVSGDDEEPQVPVCPVIRNFECEMCRTITCKRCGKISEVSEVIYDFALQLPKSVISRPNEQANLQDLLDRFFKSEDVEYKCPTCSCNTATMSCRLARLPRVMIIFLKRYGYNTNLSRNSKRIDFIRIPRFIAVGHLCSESTAPPCLYEGPWPRTSNCSLSGSCCDDKENLPSSTEGTTTTVNQSPPGENLPASSALGNNGESSSRVLGKRRGSESIEQEFGVQYCSSDCNGAVKKQRVDHQVSVSVISCEQLPASHHLDSAAQSDARDSPSSNNPPLKTDSCFVTNGTGSIAAVSNSKDFVSGSTSHDVVGYSQNSVGRDIAAEFDSLFSPEILLTLDNDPQLGVGSCNTLPSTTVTNSVAQSTQASTTSTYTTSLPPRSSSNAPAVSSVAGAETEHPLPSACERTTCNEMVVGDENGLMLGLFGGVAFENLSRPNSSNGRPEGTPTVEPNAPGARGEEEDVGLQRAMEESLREQPPSDIALLQQMGLSEEDQLRLALELSMQEQCVEDCAVDQQSSRDCAEPETPTPDAHRPQAYKLMGIVNHIGKASSGGHYISDVCSVGEGVWRSYNDSYVTEAREEDIRQRRKGTGYIFFYMHKSVLGSINNSSSKRTT